MIIALDRDQRIAVLVGQLHDAPRQLARRIVSAQLGALQTAVQLDDLRACKVAIGAAARRIHADHVLRP